MKTKSAVLLVHGMWSDQDTMHELRDAFQAHDYSVESLCLPLHYSKYKYTPAALKELGQTHLQNLSTSLNR